MTNPKVKFEHSPADSLIDSFVSTPGSQYPSLFGEESTIDPSSAIMTPPFDHSRSVSVAETPDPEESPASEKKTAKKRKSWGQQLPEPKTNLPPRKRAKTEDEKEQRRVERVLRNRRAAQSSRERKRLEVEALEDAKQVIERRNKDLELRLADLEAKNLMLQQQLAQVTGNLPVFNQPSPQTLPEQYRRAPSPITLSQELFSSRDSQPAPTFEQLPAEFTASVQTVNPASLSPEIRPVAESSFNASSSDMTQHPAEVLCDLQCQSEQQRPWMMASQQANRPSTAAISAITLCLMLISAATSTILLPLSQIINSLRTGSSLLPTPSLLNSIIWLTTTPTLLTSTTSSTPNQQSPLQPLFSLRLNLLRRLLACSPQLARPLMDATMGVLRSASEQARFQVSSECGCDGIDMVGVDGSGRGRCRHNEQQQPSIETLMTLLWATYVIDRENRSKDRHRQQHEEIKLGDYPEQLLRAADCDNKIRIKKMEKSSASFCRRSWAFEPPHERSSERGPEWGN